MRHALTVPTMQATDKVLCSYASESQHPTGLVHSVSHESLGHPPSHEHAIYGGDFPPVQHPYIHPQHLASVDPSQPTYDYAPSPQLTSSRSHGQLDDWGNPVDPYQQLHQSQSRSSLHRHHHSLSSTSSHDQLSVSSIYPSPTASSSIYNPNPSSTPSSAYASPTAVSQDEFESAPQLLRRHTTDVEAPASSLYSTPSSAYAQAPYVAQEQQPVAHQHFQHQHHPSPLHQTPRASAAIASSRPSTKSRRMRPRPQSLSLQAPIDLATPLASPSLSSSIPDTSSTRTPTSATAPLLSRGYSSPGIVGARGIGGGGSASPRLTSTHSPYHHQLAGQPTSVGMSASSSWNGGSGGRGATAGGAPAMMRHPTSDLMGVDQHGRACLPGGIVG